MASLTSLLLWVQPTYPAWEKNWRQCEKALRSAGGSLRTGAPSPVFAEAGCFPFAFRLSKGRRGFLCQTSVLLARRAVTFIKPSTAQRRLASSCVDESTLATRTWGERQSPSSLKASSLSPICSIADFRPYPYPSASPHANAVVVIAALPTPARSPHRR